jgi:hypothetical protein
MHAGVPALYVAALYGQLGTVWCKARAVASTKVYQLSSCEAAAPAAAGLASVVLAAEVCLRLSTVHGWVCVFVCDRCMCHHHLIAVIIYDK